MSASAGGRGVCVDGWRSPCGAAAIALALILAAGAPAAAQDRAFRDGMAAYGEADWAGVVESMRAAISADPQESPRRIEYGGFIGIRRRGTEYLPHYYLGEAYYRMQPSDCAAAVNAWATSEKQGVVQRRPDLVKSMQDGYAVCKQRGVLPPAEFDPLLARAEQQYNDATAAATALTALGQQNPEAWGAGVREEYGQAGAELDAARKQLLAARKTRSAKELAEATARVERARDRLGALRTTVEGTIGEARARDAIARETDQALDEADELRGQFESRLADLPSALTPTLGAARQRAQETLQRARTRSSAGLKDGDAAVLTDARALAQDAILRYRQILDELGRLQRESRTRRFTEAGTAVSQTMRLVDELFVTLDRRMAANPEVAAQVLGDRDAAAKDTETLRRRIDVATRGEQVADLEQARYVASALLDRLNELTARFGPITLRERGVSEALEAGAGHFLAGRYQEALARLNPADGVVADDPLQLHVHLFRAASFYALFVRSGETEADLRAQAAAEVEACRRIDSAFQPDPRAFSPRFLAFYRDAAADGGDTGAER